MGMAASQARYLALAARKTNIEYQGQQINQARLNLANQTATLFNQMLGINVPVPPSTQDFTINQYSFTDGINPAVIDKWEQLANPDTDGYNYVVEYHYDANVYTGFQKKMNDPQIQFSIAVPNDVKSTTERDEVNKIYAQQTAVKQAQDDYDTEEAKLTALKTKAAKLATYRDMTTTATTLDPTTGKNTNANVVFGAHYDESEKTYYVYGTNVTTEPQTKGAEHKYVLFSELKDAAGTAGSGTPGDPGYVAPSADYTAATVPSKSEAQKIIDAWKADGISVDETKLYFCADATGDFKGTFAFESDLDALKGDGDTTGDHKPTEGVMSTLPMYHAGTENTQDTTDYASVFGMQFAISEQTTKTQTALNTLKSEETKLETLNIPTYVGNTKLESLSELSQEEFAEIKQIITDMTKNGVDSNFTKCFTSSLNISAKDYSGGIYKFQRDGVTYYTTYWDLAETANESEFMNDIDNQPKLNYYHANYVTQPVYKSDKAILDTDSQGRFKSVRFKEDGAQYTLNFEQKTDDEAYQDAMNKYYYENAKYDKMIQDINAKTSIIQQEDRTLELKLKQLDTEQTALSNEMEAVQKVVKDGVEKGFKTFGG